MTDQKPPGLANLEAEFAVLGIALYRNDAVETVEGLRPEHFAEPFHQRLWARIMTLVGRGQLAEPITIADAFTADPVFEVMGGLSFLVDLVDRAPASSNAPAYARAIINLAQRRDLMALADNIAGEARNGAEEAGEIISRAEAGLLALQVRTRPLEMVSAGAASSQVLAYLDAPPEEAPGIKTGLEPLDEAMGPMLPGNLVLLMGRPSMGKSAASECIALNIAQGGGGVMQVNGEMSPEEMTQRHLTDLCHARWGSLGPEYRDIRRRKIGYDQRRMLEWAHDQITGLPLSMIKRPGLKLSQLRSLARRQKAVWARQGIPFAALIIDHVGLIKTDHQSRDRYADQALISAELKELADELECVVIGLNQMNRQNESRDDKRPQLSDLRDSGTWEQDADFVVGWYREAYYASRQAEPKKAEELAEWLRAKSSRTVEASILKARAGECTTVSLWGDVARNAIRGHAPFGE